MIMGAAATRVSPSVATGAPNTTLDSDHERASSFSLARSSSDSSSGIRPYSRSIRSRSGIVSLVSTTAWSSETGGSAADVFAGALIHGTAHATTRAAIVSSRLIIRPHAARFGRI